MHNSRSHTPETEIIKSSLEDRYKSPDGKHDRQTMKIGHTAEAKGTNCSGDDGCRISDRKQDGGTMKGGMDGSQSQSSKCVSGSHTHETKSTNYSQAELVKHKRRNSRSSSTKNRFNCPFDCGFFNEM